MLEWTNPALERRQLLSKPTAREYASGAALMRAFQLKRGQSRVPRESFPVHSSVGLGFSPSVSSKRPLSLRVQRVRAARATMPQNEHIELHRKR